MRCFRECHPTIYKIPPKETLETEFPICSKCGDNMRPNILWFDESYNEKIYRKETVKNFSDDIDAIVVIGTTLETNLANMLVMKALERDQLVIEINPESVVTEGHVLQVREKSEIALQELL